MRFSPILLSCAVLAAAACGRGSEPAPASNNATADTGAESIVNFAAVQAAVQPRRGDVGGDDYGRGRHFGQSHHPHRCRHAPGALERCQ